MPSRRIERETHFFLFHVSHHYSARAQGLRSAERFEPACTHVGGTNIHFPAAMPSTDKALLLPQRHVLKDYIDTTGAEPVGATYFNASLLGQPQLLGHSGPGPRAGP